MRSRSCIPLTFALLLFGCALARPAAAQAIVVTVNGDPITTSDIDGRMKIMRVLHRPAGRDAAVEDLIEDRLRARDAEKYGVRYTDSDIPDEISVVASLNKTTPAALSGALQGAGVGQDAIRGYFGPRLAFEGLVKALNKGVEASETQVRAELAKERVKGGETEYVLRQVVVATPSNASPADLASRVKVAEQLRTRFASCDDGSTLVREMNEVVLREAVTRTSTQLGEGLRQVLDKTPVGHLTPPQRSVSGLEMVAVCSRGASKDDSALRTSISNRLLAAHLQDEAARRLKDLRSHAIITKPQG